MLSTESISVFVAEHSTILREALIASLGSTNGISIAGSAAARDDVIMKVRQLAPQVVLWGPKGANVLDALAQLKAAAPDSRILVMHERPEPAYIHQLVQAGADGVCANDTKIRWLVTGISSVAAGQSWLGPCVTERMLEAIRTSGDDFFIARHSDARALTVCETHVLELLIQGVSDLDIANSLKISIYSVKRQIQAICEKLQVNGRTQLLTEALRRGLVA